MKKLLSIISAILLLGTPALPQTFPGASGNPSPLSRPGGVYYAPGFFWTGRIISGNSATGAQTIIFAGNAGGGIGGFTTPDGTVISPDVIANTLSPIIVDWGQGAQETVTPTAMSVSTCPAGNLGVGGVTQCISATATFANTHGQSAVVADGAYGAQTAVNLANRYGGGTVVVDSVWTQMGGTNAILTAMIPYGNVQIADNRAGIAQSWQSAQQVATVLAAPTTLTATTVGFGINGANATGGTYTGTSTYHVCIAYVDIMGNEGPCSADFSGLTAGTSATTYQIGFSAPAASTGAVGYTVYISLAGGTYNLTYQVPLTSSVCTLTTLETTTPACKVTNATYNQTGSAAVVSALTVATAPLHLLATTTSAAGGPYIGTPSGRTTYAYAPTGNLDSTGLTSTQMAYAIATAAASATPQVIGTIPIPTGALNFVGRSLCIEGQATEATAGSTATVQQVEFFLDAAGNASGKGAFTTPISNLELTATLVTSNADFWSFHTCFQTTAAGTSATSGGIQPFSGTLVSTYGAGVLGNAGTEVTVAPVTSLNLAGTGGNTQRIHIVWLHTTGTDANGVTLLATRAWWQ